MSDHDENYLSTSALSADAHLMDKCSTILLGITPLLEDETIDGLRREALLKTLELMAYHLADRADFLREERL